MLKIDNITKSFSVGTETRRALDGVSLNVKKGDFITIIGANGAGKSTLFNAIAGSFITDSGTISLDGQDITLMSEYKRAHSIGRLFQDPLRGTAPSMTIEENLALAYLRAAHGNPFSRISKKDKEFFAEQLKQLDMGLEDRMKQPVGLLSGGQRQTLALLMATMTPIDFLILDEHTAALDPKTAEIVMQLTNKVVQEKHLTTLMVTHNLRHAVEYGDRLLMMHQGHVIMDKAGDEKRALKVDDLLDVFTSISIECGN